MEYRFTLPALVVALVASAPSRADVLMPITGYRALNAYISVPGEDTRDWEYEIEYTVGSLDSLRAGCGMPDPLYPLRNPAIVSETLEPSIPSGGLDRFIAAARGGLTSAHGGITLREVPDGEGGLRPGQSWFRITARSRSGHGIIGCTVTELTRTYDASIYVHCDRPGTRSARWTALHRGDSDATSSDLAGTLAVAEESVTENERERYGWDAIRAGSVTCAAVSERAAAPACSGSCSLTEGGSVVGTTEPRAALGR